MALRKREVIFTICFRKREYPEREGGGQGFLQKKGVPALEETVAISELLDLVEVRAL